MSDRNYEYQKIIIPTGEFFKSSLQKYQLQLLDHWHLYQSTFLSIIIFSLLWGTLLANVERFKTKSLARYIVSFFSIFFIIMTFCNWHFGKNNTVRMKEVGMFTHKVIGNGPEIYFFDYFFDYYQSIKTSTDSGSLSKLENSKAKYFQVLRTQVIQSTPEFDQVLREEPDDFSFWINE